MASMQAPVDGTQVRCSHCGHEFRAGAQETVLLEEGIAQGETAAAGAPAVQVICAECGSVLGVEPGVAEVRCSRCGRAYPILGESLRTDETLAVSEPGETIATEKSAAAGSALAGRESSAVLSPAEQARGSVGPAGDTGLVETQPRSRKAVVGEPRPRIPTRAAPPALMQRDTTGLSWLHEHLAGRYEVLEFLGRGGMGAVYKARQRTPPRMVALKVMLGGVMVSERARRRFEREAMAASKVQHQAIVPVYEVGDVGGQPYYTMEFVQGQDLRAYVLSNKLNRRQVCELMVQVCRAVDFAHTHGIIHRDLKPGNILVDAQGRCRLLDFGLARIAREDEEGQVSMLTVSGDILGTPRYMRPEQAAGKPKEIDGRTDVYSLGVIFYELVVGIPPYNLEGLQGYQALQAIRSADPLRPSRIHPWFPTDLEAVLLKALEKEKPNRYRSAKALADDIENFMADRPVTARPATPGYRFRKFLWRNRRIILPVTAGVLLLGLVGGVLGGLWWGTRTKLEAKRIEAELKSVGIENMRTHILTLAADGEWQKACASAEVAETSWPDEPSVKGLSDAIRGMAKEKLRQAAAQIDALIRAQDYERARTEANALAALGKRLCWPDLEEQATNKAQQFDDDCWADIQKVVEEAHVYTRQSSLAFVNNFLARFGGGPQGEDARKLLDRLREAPDAYYLEQRLRALSREMVARDWDAAVTILEGAGKAVEEASVEDKEAWGSKFAAVQGELEAIIWHSTAGSVGLIRSLDGHEGFVKGVCFEPRTGDRLVSGASDRTVRLWSSASGELVDSLTCSGPVRTVAFSPDGAQVVAACEDYSVHLWLPVEHSSRSWASGHGNRLQAAAFSPQGDLLFTASSDGVKLWNVLGHEPVEVRQLVGAKSPAAIVPAGDMLAAAAGEGRIGIWQLGSGEAVKDMPCPSVPLSLAASADGKLLAAGCMDNMIRIWDLQTGGLLHTLAGHSRNVTAVAFSPDGRILASAGPGKPNSVVILWNLRAQNGASQELKRLEGHGDDWIMDVAFSPDGKLLASAGNDKRVCIWGVKRPSGTQ